MDERPRGIPNVSGVACHLSSALQLLLHAIPQIRMVLLEISKHSSSSREDWIQELANLTFKMFDTCSDGEVNPMPLYKALSSRTTRLDPHELGDAATALRILLHTILQQQQDALQPILKHSVLGGTIEQTLTGTCIQNNRKIRRIKTSKEKSMSCPFSITVTDATTSLSEALSKATIEPQVMIGLDWNQISNYREEEQEDTDDEGQHSGEWTTTKTVCFSSLAQHVLIHLQRAQYDEQHDGIKLSSNIIDIPTTLNMKPYMKKGSSAGLPSCCLAYQFAGAILHVSDDDSDPDEEDGHYVALVHQESNDCWYVMDDEKVTLVPNDEQQLVLMDFVSGRSRPLDEGLSYCATVLVYSKTCDCDNATNMSLMDDFRETLQQQQQQDAPKKESSLEVDWSQPHQVVGRRLRIRWKSGKYYSGVVSSYDVETGKHRITYDDGDVRHYALSKKTIEWLDPA